MTPGALGPSGVQQRMEQIQAKMDAVFGTHNGEFESVLASAQGGLAGDLPAGMDGNLPMSTSDLSLVPEGAEPLKQMAVAAAQRYGIDPSLYVALINKESAFNPYSRSGKGALGLAQLMPDTAKGLGVRNVFDPAQNLDAGAKYLAQLLDQFGTPELALAAYNAGPKRVMDAGGIPDIPETRDYVASIMRAVAGGHGQ